MGGTSILCWLASGGRGGREAAARAYDQTGAPQGADRVWSEDRLIRRNITVLRLSFMAADALTAAGLFVIVSIFRWGPGWLEAWASTGLVAPLGMAAWAGLWVLALWVQGHYRLRAHLSARADLMDLIRTTMLVGISVFGILFAIHLPQVSRLFLIELFVVQLAVAVVSRLVIRMLFAAARRNGANTRYVLVAGTSLAAQAFADRIEAHPELGLRVIGHLGRGAPAGQRGPRRPILGRLEDIEDVLHAEVVDEVAICLGLPEWNLVEAITRICADEGKLVRLPSDGSTPRLTGSTVEEWDGLTVQSLVHGPDRALSLLAKRLLDVAGGLVLLLLATPVLLIACGAILLGEGRPIIFRQVRVGLHGRQFGLYKFRTMVTGAEEQLDSLLEQNEVSGAAFKVTRDPRITRVGRYLRKTSIDELPQLWNVIRGEMSLVGPRPPLPREVAAYDVWHRRRLSMKPGITGLWQVSERHSHDFDRWVALDLAYIDRWSLWLDLKIIARTLPAMLHGR